MYIDRYLHSDLYGVVASVILFSQESVDGSTKDFLSLVSVLWVPFSDLLVGCQKGHVTYTTRLRGSVREQVEDGNQGGTG